MENEIGRYLGQVGDAHLSDETKEKIRGMLRQIGELESVGDSGYNLARILQRKKENKIVFSPEQEQGIVQMYELIDAATSRMNVLLQGHREDYTIDESAQYEVRINALRNTLKQQNITDLKRGSCRNACRERLQRPACHKRQRRGGVHRSPPNTAGMCSIAGIPNRLVQRSRNGESYRRGYRILA